MGKPVPGHTVAVIGRDGAPLKAGEIGQIAVKRPDPVMFLEYWGRPDATREKFIGDWMTTGDQGVIDEDGYITFVGRDDDVITSSGFRIGPGEIEDCLLRHPAVALAAAVGKPDPIRTEIVKAFIVLKPGHPPSDALAAEIQGFVKTRLSAHEYPREVAFIDADADDHDRQGDPAAAQGAGVAVGSRCAAREQVMAEPPLGGDVEHDRTRPPARSRSRSPRLRCRAAGSATGTAPRLIAKAVA